MKDKKKITEWAKRVSVKMVKHKYDFGTPKNEIPLFNSELDTTIFTYLVGVYSLTAP